jgi:lysyl-tRNA synthetase class I
MYREGLFDEIIDYVTRERDAAMDLLKESRGVIGDLGDRRRRPIGPGEAKS